MSQVKVVDSSKSQQKIRPALTPEARENQLIALAVDLVEKRLLEGTASSQETTHFLKLASTKARLEKELLIAQKQLMNAKASAIDKADNAEELYKNAIAAMQIYSGNRSSAQPEEEDYDDE